jgi:hypothetical protein
MSAAKKGSERKVRSSAALSDEERELYGAAIDHAVTQFNLPVISERIIELRFILENTVAGQQAIKASIDTLKRFHEPSIPEAILMPMAIGIMIGIHVSETAHAANLPPKPPFKPN